MSEIFGIENKKYCYHLSELNAFKFQMDISLDSYLLFINDFDNCLKHFKNQFDAKVKDDPANVSLNEQEYSQYYAQMFSIEESVISELRRQHSYALCMALNSYVETRLIELVEIVSRKGFSAKVFKKIKAESDLDRCWKYLTEVQNLNLSESESAFAEICAHKKIRNKITHQDGYLKKAQLVGIENQSSIKFITVGNLYLIELSKEYLLMIHKQIGLFLTGLLNNIDEQLAT